MSRKVDIALSMFESLLNKGMDEDEAAHIVDYAMGFVTGLDDTEKVAKPEGAHVYNHSDQLQNSVEIGQTAKVEW